MRCKACNKLLTDPETNNINKMVDEVDLCRLCLNAADNAITGKQSLKVQKLQDSSGFKNVWG